METAQMRITHIFMAGLIMVGLILPACGGGGGGGGTVDNGDPDQKTVVTVVNMHDKPMIGMRAAAVGYLNGEPFTVYATAGGEIAYTGQAKTLNYEDLGELAVRAGQTPVGEWYQVTVTIECLFEGEDPYGPWHEFGVITVVFDGQTSQVVMEINPMAEPTFLILP